MESIDEQWVSRQEAARRAGVHYNTIRNEWEPTGRLRTKKVRRGKSYEVLIELSSLDALIASRHTAGRSTQGGDERIAALEAENRELRAALASERAERRELVERVLRIVET